MRFHAFFIAASVGMAAQGALAKDYRCAPWQPDTAKVAPLQEITVLKDVAVLNSDGLKTSIRMAYSTLRRRTYLDDESSLFVHGAPKFGPDGPAFGDTITVQRLVHDAKSPLLVQTDCEVR